MEERRARDASSEQIESGAGGTASFGLVFAEGFAGWRRIARLVVRFGERFAAVHVRGMKRIDALRGELYIAAVVAHITVDEFHAPRSLRL
jgi:hypothetical protein